MKKLFIFVSILLLISGCGKYGKKDLINDISKKVNNSDSYHLSGTLDIYRNEEKYSYDVDSSYMKGDYFKVDLINKNNNHKQIILKNQDGVYVLTPSLNKSFKFQSDWPYNNSQIYLLQPIINDINNDTEIKYEENKDGYIITGKVNYSTEKDFVNQKVYIDKDKNIYKVEILDKNDTVKMVLNITDIDYKPSFDNDYFSESKYKVETSEDSNDNTQKTEENDKEGQKQDTTTNTTNEEKKELSSDQTTAHLNEIVYPMYVPTDTYLSGQDVVSTTSGERVILTFNGESSFTVVQENLSNQDTTNYVYGDPYLILDTVGSITDYSVSWISNGVEYSVLSDTMNIDELLTVAQSISVKAVAK